MALYSAVLHDRPPGCREGLDFRAMMSAPSRVALVALSILQVVALEVPHQTDV
jgi:hypothetical protein